MIFSFGRERLAAAIFWGRITFGCKLSVSVYFFSGVVCGVLLWGGCGVRRWRCDARAYQLYATAASLKVVAH